MSTPGLPSALLDAWVSYAIDPRRWEQLVAELEFHAELLASLDPSEFLASFSKAEALSWRIRSEEGNAPGGFAYVLLDQHDQVISRRDEGRLLDNYLHGADLKSGDDPELSIPARAGLTTSREDSTGSNTDWDPLIEQRIHFTHTDTQDSWARLKAGARPSSSGHFLIELRDASGERARYGYIISRADFPSSLLAISERAERALLVPETTMNPALRKTLQSSFGLTQAEVDVTLLLASGYSLKEVGAYLRVSVNTARNQLQSVFAKSGVSRQSELILVVTQLGIIVATNGAENRDVNTKPSVTGSAPEPPRAKTHDQPPLEMLALPDGRQLAYRCYGVRDGQPVLYLHETYGTSRLPDRTHTLAVERNLFLISPDRPGFGFSNSPAAPSMPSVAADLKVLVEKLMAARSSERLTHKIVLCGFVSGAGYALELAHNAGAEVAKLLLVAGRAPFSLSAAEAVNTRGNHGQKTTSLERFRAGFVKQPWLLNSFFNILRNRSNPALYAMLLQRAYGGVSRDQELFESQPELLDYLVDNCIESQSVSAVGPANDMRAYIKGSQRSPQELTAPIWVWHGTEDQVASPAVLRQCLHDCHVDWRDFAGEGSMLLHRHYEEWLDELARVT